MPRKSRPKTKQFGVYEKVKEGMFLISSFGSFRTAVEKANSLLAKSRKECKNTDPDQWKLYFHRCEEIVAYRRGNSTDFIIASRKNGELLKAIGRL